MKRILAIALIFVLALNIIGYYGVFLGMQHLRDVAMAATFDAGEYNESETIRIAIPVSVPYMADDLEFKRVDGKFEYQGEHYRLVKQKYTQDTLMVVCVRDNDAKEMDKALEDYLTSFTDKPHEQSQASKISQSFSKDYLSQIISLSTLSMGWEITATNFADCPDLVPSFYASLIHPPERA